MPDGSETNIKRSIDKRLKVLDGKKAFLNLHGKTQKLPKEEPMDTMTEYVKKADLVVLV